MKFDKMAARLEEAVSRMTQEEAAALLDALKVAERLGGFESEALMLAIARVGCAYSRTRKKADQDAAADKNRRVLVGARIPRTTADKYRRLAQYQGVSLYAWVCDALDREYRRQSPETK